MAESQGFLRLTVLAVLAVLPPSIAAQEDPFPGHTGAPGDRSAACIVPGCRAGVVNTGGGTIRIVASGGTSYVPGEKQTISVTIIDASRNHYGFQLTARIDDTPKPTEAGLFLPGNDGFTRVLCANRTSATAGGCILKSSPSLEWIEQTLTGYDQSAGTPGNYTYTFNWTAPDRNVGAVTLYGTGIAADGTIAGVANIYTTSLHLVPLAQNASAVSLTSSSNPSNFGQDVTLTATVSPSAATGKVTFYDGATVLGSSILNNGMASLATGLLPSGTRSLKAYYTGNGTYSAGVSPNLPQTVSAMAGNGFRPASIYSAGSFPISVVTADFNGDGKPDLAIANYNASGLNGGGSTAGGDAVTLFLGNGDGTFRLSATLIAGSGPRAIAVADVNGDGKPDLAVANTFSNNVSLFLGNGDGTFQPAVLLKTGSNPRGIAAADLNGDGNVDLVVANNGDETVSVLLGNGDGTFQPASPFLVGTNPRAIVAGDFNQDGKIDLAVADDFDCLVVILLGTGTGAFVPAHQYEAGVYAESGSLQSLAVGDFNGDGKLDLAVTDVSYGAVSVLLGNGDGSFQATPYFSLLSTTPTYSTGFRNASSVVVGDFNGDGKADLAVTNYDGNNVGIFFGNGDGSFQSPQDSPLGGSGAYAAAVGEFNGDGRADLVAVNFAGNSFSVLLGNTPGRLKFGTQPVSSVTGIPLPAVTVQMLDASGNPAATGVPVTLTSSPAGIYTTVAAVNGVATFNNLVFSSPGTYTLTATAPGMTSAASNSFNISLPTFTISGQVTWNGAGLGGVSVNLSGSQNMSATTDAAGSYTFSGLAMGGGYIVAPALTGYLFTPANQIFANLTSNQSANFTAAAAGSVLISGQVTVSGTGSAGVTITVNGTQSGSVTTGANGNYSITVTRSGSYTVSAARIGYSFSAPMVLSNVSANQIANFSGIPVAGLAFYPVTPCRLVDTRISSFPPGFGPPSLAGGSIRTFNIPSNTACAIPTTASAYSLNVTVVTKGYLGTLSIFPAGQPLPNVSTLNSYASTSTAAANAAIVAAGAGGAVNVYVTDATDLIIDINGYFAPPAPGGLEFYPVAPCRLVDTRVSAFQSGFGPPSMTAGQITTYPIPSNSSCGIPATATAYSLNITAIPRNTLGLLSIWPTGKPLPNVSTLNVYTAGMVVANAAIVPAGINGAINTYVSDPTDLLIDINGYFAPPATNGLKLYPIAPCRVVDTRVASFPAGFGPPAIGAGTQRSFAVPQSSCGIPSGAGAYSFNFTVVPQAPQLGIFTTWPTGLGQPNVSTLNSYDGSVDANAAIVAAGSNGAISIYVTDTSDALFDINGYFAP